MGLRLRTLTTWLSAALALSSCGSQPLPGGAPATLEEGCTDLGQAACAAFERCSPENFGSRYPDRPSCVSVRTLDCVERRSAPGNTVTPDQVEACAQATSKNCSEIVANEFGVNPQRDPACVWQGTLPEGEACIASSQCATGTCSFYDRDACGTCVARADSICLTANECSLGSYCINGQCVAAGKLGEACRSLSPCTLGLTCRAGSCASPGQVGDTCTGPGSGACAAELWCNEQSGLCEHATLALGSDACGVSTSGGKVLCPAGNVCLPDAASGTNHCVAAGAEGTPCSYELECGVGLACLESSCSRLRAAACAAPDTTPNATYPALLPSVPQAVAPAAATLLTTPKIVLITFEGDSRASSLEAFVNALGSSTYWQAVTSEYGIGPLTALPPIRVAEAPPMKLPDADIQSWLSDKLLNDPSFPQNDARTLYAIAYPKGVTVTTPGSDGNDDNGQSCADFGGYHSSFNGPDATPTPYAVIPDCAFISAEEALSHEAIEAATDPFANLAAVALSGVHGYLSVDVPHFGWSLPSAGIAELADLCEWQPFATYQDPEVGGLVQRSWSNAAMAAFHEPCVPARDAAAYFNSVPHFDDQVSLKAPGTAPVRTHGIAIPLGQSQTVPVDLLSDAPTGGPWRVSAYDLKEWTQAFDYRTQTEPTLSFSFDKQSGVNGDTLQMTITVLQQDSDYQAEPFVLVSRRGRDTNLWVGVVGQP